MLLKAPFSLPHGFIQRLGYPGCRLLVGLYWQVIGDESAFDDGVVCAGGMTDCRVFLEFIQRPDVFRWLYDAGLCLGASDRPAEHWLIVNRVTGEVWSGEHMEARRAVACQELPRG